MISDFLNWIGSFFQNLFKTLFGWIADLFGYLFQKLFDFLKFLLNPVLIVIALIFYFLYKLAALVLLLLQVLLAIGKLFVSMIKGLFMTLAGFSYTPTVRSDGQWSSIFSNLNRGLGDYQLDNLAYVLLFIIWFGTAFAAIRILSSMKGGDDD
ncbi:hypothetical protein [Paenibacillus ehimensis]|uniref:hypothetical protein n=1 Tax=Paenibacillus ehimensis TaxID=79264 RepID=UPI000FDADC71|nr:hypothetical protein [Paenibacillus ehimensis]